MSRQLKVGACSASHPAHGERQRSSKLTSASLHVRDGSYFPQYQSSGTTERAFATSGLRHLRGE